MGNSKLFLAALFIFPWLTIPLLGRKAFKRYSFSALFIVILTKILDEYGRRKKWWRFYKGIPPLHSMDLFNFGAYFVTSLWMLKMTYGRFLLYLCSNTLLHIVFIYGMIKFVKRFKILSLVKLNKFQYLIIDFIRSLLLYGFQVLTDSFSTSSLKKGIMPTIFRK